VRCGASTAWTAPRMRPAATRATVYGTWKRRATIATAVATVKSVRNIVSRCIDYVPARAPGPAAANVLVSNTILIEPARPSAPPRAAGATH
jgi:hypothetical protein